jgi:hypothetical protein
VKANTILQCIIFIKYYIQNAKSSTIELFVIIRKREITLELRKVLQKNTLGQNLEPIKIPYLIEMLPVVIVS